MVLYCQTEVTINAPATFLKSLVAATSAATDTLTPPTGKRIIVLGVLFGNICVGSALTSTVEASLCFGTGGLTDDTKLFWSGGATAKDCEIGAAVTNLRLIGEIDEVVTLTNITYSVGQVTTRATITYYFSD